VCVQSVGSLAVSNIESDSETVGTAHAHKGLPLSDSTDSVSGVSGVSVSNSAVSSVSPLVS